jgi:hypothetical protein
MARRLTWTSRRWVARVDRQIEQTARSATGGGTLRVRQGRSIAIHSVGQTVGDSPVLEFRVGCIAGTCGGPSQVGV